MKRDLYNQRMVFEWDATKAATNLLKHSVSFEEAPPSSATLSLLFSRIRIILSANTGLLLSAPQFVEEYWPFHSLIEESG